MRDHLQRCLAARGKVPPAQQGTCSGRHSALSFLLLTLAVWFRESLRLVNLSPEGRAELSQVLFQRESLIVRTAIWGG